eukprot:CAMPEP_0196809070 /NCGR_PEP_ID=MMETSP1362-20130617/9032_1 /TAXON_ID=163516 /ORGANISM="Leptocylindrus danicus, Strain CCMP1856" /LENGTH=909 /DNA_ID=CAMNT_0042183635 /DNA_START=103 /DNA_END=2832 /DNA_ORIENTATION=-
MSFSKHLIGAYDMPYSFCNTTSLELKNLDHLPLPQPCVLYDERPNAAIGENTFEVTMVQVTPTICTDHRDGPVTAVQKMNEDSDGAGVKIGFYEDHFVKFRLVSVVAGRIDDPGYEDSHASALEALLQSLAPQYIIGTCSFAAAFEKDLAKTYETILMSQVGPPGFYLDDNRFVFGIHLTSDGYSYPALWSFFFDQSEDEREKDGESASNLQPIKVIHRDRSEFFNSTCRSAFSFAKDVHKYSDVTAIEYNPYGDADGNGVQNFLDVAFLNSLADQACPMGADFQPVLLMCVGGGAEVDTILARLRYNHCEPSLVWATPSTWGWAFENNGTVPFFFGGGQWHQTFNYEDDFFSNGKELLQFNEVNYGYSGSYDTVASYAIPWIFSRHIISHFRIFDVPNVTDVFLNNYEQMRRSLAILNANSIFGKVSFDENQRNIGRSAAGVQWLPNQSLVNRSQTTFIDSCISPFDQASAAPVFPAPIVDICSPGMFVDKERLVYEECFLCEKCVKCAADTYTDTRNRQYECELCPSGSFTETEGMAFCSRKDENLIPLSLKVLGYTFFAINCLLAATFIVWMMLNRDDAVVKIGQFPFLLTICIGAIVSSSSIIALSIEAGKDEKDKAAATIACQAIPFLYTTGWILQYASLSAKSFRLYRIVDNPRMQRRAVKASSMITIVAIPLLLDWIVVIPWTIFDPLEYTREVESFAIEGPVQVTESFGHCESDYMFWFIVVIGLMHFCLMVGTNIILFKIRGVASRYQESNYVRLACAFVAQVLVMGVPILLAVRSSTEALYFVLSAIVFLNDFAILCFIFIPKIKHQQQGLPDGVSTAQSVLKSEAQIAEDRHKARVSMQTLGDFNHSHFRSSGSRITLPPVENERVSFSCSPNCMNGLPPIEDTAESADEVEACIVAE